MYLLNSLMNSVVNKRQKFIFGNENRRRKLIIKMLVVLTFDTSTTQRKGIQEYHGYIPPLLCVSYVFNICGVKGQLI